MGIECHGAAARCLDPCQHVRAKRLIGIKAAASDLRWNVTHTIELFEPMTNEAAMGYKTLSVIVTDQAADAATLATAADLALREDGHLDVFCLGVDPARYEPLPAGSAVAVLQAGASEARSRADELAVWARSELDRLPNATVEPVVVPQMGIDVGLARMTRYSDLVICAKPYGRTVSALQVTILEAVLFGTGAPVLIVGKDMSIAEPPHRVMLAWDESREALTAARFALPMLKKADRVDVVMVDPPTHSPERSDPGGALCVMLARHGVRAEVSILARTLPRVSDCLARFAREHDCDLITMGAYGHSRLREAMLGGPTRDMLEVAEMPLFMGH